MDRSYQIGGRYEFHPTNATSPFVDNECTATQLLSMTPVASAAPSDRGRLEAYVGGGLAAVFAAGALASLVMRRRRSRPLAGPQSSAVEPSSC